MATHEAGRRPPAGAASVLSRLLLTGFVDGVYAFNFNRPADHENFIPSTGTSAKRDNEMTINLAQLDLLLPPEPVGLHLAIGYGDAEEVVHGAEPDKWENVVQASIQYQTSIGRGLLLEGGVYPSHIGMEGFATKDNWNYTRSWLGELSPYYQTGVKAAYPFSERWSGQLHFLNGWQVIDDTNRGKTVGAQAAYSSGVFSLSFNGIAGPEQPDNDDDVRALFDTVALYRPTPSLSFGLSFDVAREERPGSNDAHWQGAGVYARLAPTGWRTAFALRGEYYDDEDGAISGFAQDLREVTLTVEHRPVDAFIVKLEGRYDRSSEDVFAIDEVDANGDPLRDRDQALLLAGVVALF